MESDSFSREIKNAEDGTLFPFVSRRIKPILLGFSVLSAINISLYFTSFAPFLPLYFICNFFVAK